MREAPVRGAASLGGGACALCRGPTPTAPPRPSASALGMGSVKGHGGLSEKATCLSSFSPSPPMTGVACLFTRDFYIPWTPPQHVLKCTVCTELGRRPDILKCGYTNIKTFTRKLFISYITYQYMFLITFYQIRSGAE